MSARDDEDALKALECEWAAAIVADAEAIGRFMTEDRAIVTAEGTVVERARFLEAVESGALTHDGMDFDEWRVTVHGDTAVVTTRARTSGAYQGNAFTTEERSTSVYTKREDGRRCVFTHLTELAAK
jgi:ketosteroid isomerase-like protein